jgi:Na+/pantothenate symporter
MVRLMACRDTPTLRRSLFLIGVYYALIYLPLVVTFICARALFPTEYVGDRSDQIMPTMAVVLTERFPLVGGLILAAPYAAAMSAVAGFLLLMSSSLVRDLIQRNLHANISPAAVKRISYGTTAVVGIVVALLALHPPEKLQYLIIFSTSGMACTFLAPTVMALYWKGATRAGALAAMVGGFATVFVLYLINAILDLLREQSLAGITLTPVYPLGLDPLVYGFVVSIVAGFMVSRWTHPLPTEHVNRYFLEDQETAKT